ncbi:HAD-IA family hydrolase [Ornithinibacillus halotolerans]|uniref:Phosphoglycolate phosphatase n=1 Tax=Ornithinibacillus halotolerans TaxID=1274357 RepID=A0A916RWM2_9BACI|nr:HAD-IA family hydrolase [Ornithinibacillus halotolerans]GGA74384.1 phosphoglycolate phosphatase [Ornithinibacillus halotolerans]
MNNNKGLTILWDFDGTLFDTYPVYTKLFKKVLADRNIDEKDVYQNIKISFRHANNYYNLSEEQLKEFASLEEEIPPQEMMPFSGVEKVLQYANNNVIMTHKLGKDVRKILRYYGWEKYFSEIVAGDDGFPRKPNKESYEYLHEKYNIDLVIGDRELDIIPAKELNIKSCLFQNNKSNLADFYLNDYGEFWTKVVEEFN